MPTMTRRRITACGAAAVFMPAIARAQTLDDVASAAARLGQLRALVIHRDGQRVFSASFRGPAPDRPANIKSVSKTLIALMTGMAIDRGIISGPDQLVLPLLGRAPFGDARDALNIGHLLTMRAGLGSTSGAAYGAWVSSPDWVESALTQPLADRPGGRFIYSTGGWHILGAALAQAAGISLHAMACDWLGAPLGITVPPWISDPQGRFLGGNDMAISPVALARIGDMVLNNGRMDGHQIVSADWLNASMRARTQSPFSGDSYGYGWFLTRHAGESAAYGRGYGGQMLTVVPARRLSIAITSDPDRPARGDGFFGELRRLTDRIVAAA
ncbi:MAG: serine hydrolase [Paracoccus sp. (in: a-proteobacteria)]|nr:serine hydrolase [Paracoccus sp. (in: a-proteobacteria)]